MEADMEADTETDMDNFPKDIRTHIYREELFSGKNLDVRDFNKLMPKHRSLKIKENTDTDRSLNKIMDDSASN